MKNLISISDFKNPYLVYAETGKPSEIFLNELIAENQEIYLKKILGFRLYNELDIEFSKETPTDLFWIDFVNGKNYIYNGISYNYKGIKEILCNIIYWFWHEKNLSQLNKTGDLIPIYENGQKNIPVHLMCEAWNKADRLLYNVDVYAPTVYNYLNHNYIGNLLEFNTIKRKNLFGI